ncbi:hypothetical protein [Maricaulis sp.]|uniref:hypothetical protein n=1 Tax=Maricaulis sp. TaxID=1486257 RepID=UPI002B2656A3|nr:hypothetical protein [Maricaulis sp.]
MSFNRVIILPDHACVEAIIDGYEDWDSATEVIVEMCEQVEARSWKRILIDFRRVNLRVSRSEAHDIANFFNSFVNYAMNIAVWLPAGERDAEVINTFARRMDELGHAMTPIRTVADRDAWLVGPLPKAANA